MILASPKSQILTTNPCPLISTFAGFRSLWTTLAECRYLSLNMAYVLPTKNLIENESDILNLEEDIIAFENFLQIAITELGDEIDMVEIIDGLIFGYEYFNHSYDIWVFTILQKDDLPQYSASLW